jgi:WD40 repeat protein
VLAQDPDLDVRRIAWAPDGRVGAALLVERLVSVEPDQPKRPLGDGISAITFGPDAATLYAVRVTDDGANDVASVLRIDYASGDTEPLASVTYPRPVRSSDGTLTDAAYEDEGGPVRLFWTMDATLRLWVVNTGAWEIDPQGGDATEVDDATTVLWSPEQDRRVRVSYEDATSTLVLYRRTGQEIARTEIGGLVSHLRWSPDGRQVVFTRGRGTANGGVLQDLFLWQLGDGVAPRQMTNTGAGFGAEWLGATSMWGDAG